MVLFYICICICIWLFMFMFISKDHFYLYEKCIGKRDGVSGCRTCCQYYKSNYNECVNKCMN